MARPLWAGLNHVELLMSGDDRMNRLTPSNATSPNPHYGSVGGNIREACTQDNRVSSDGDILTSPSVVRILFPSNIDKQGMDVQGTNGSDTLSDARTNLSSANVNKQGTNECIDNHAVDYDDHTISLKQTRVDKEVEKATANKKERRASVTREAAKISTNTGAPQNSISADNSGGCEWSNDELNALRNAQKEINPTSISYWQEVAIKVKTKSSLDCQNKWQATPKVRKTVKKKKATKDAVFDASISDSDEEEDDLFNSSPYRKAYLEDKDNMITINSRSLWNSSGLSPCIKQKTNLNSLLEEQSALKPRRKGYNTYVENLRKDINRVEKKKKAQRSSPLANERAHIHADLLIGESHMLGNLRSDGTVKLFLREECSDLDESDDLWAEEEEED